MALNSNNSSIVFIPQFFNCIMTFSGNFRASISFFNSESISICFLFCSFSFSISSIILSLSFLSLYVAFESISALSKAFLSSSSNVDLMSNLLFARFVVISFSNSLLSERFCFKRFLIVNILRYSKLANAFSLNPNFNTLSFNLYNVSSFILSPFTVFLFFLLQFSFVQLYLTNTLTPVNPLFLFVHKLISIQLTIQFCLVFFQLFFQL